MAPTVMHCILTLPGEYWGPVPLPPPSPLAGPGSPLGLQRLTETTSNFGLGAGSSWAGFGGAAAGRCNCATATGCSGVMAATPGCNARRGDCAVRPTVAAMHMAGNPINASTTFGRDSL